MLSAVRLPSALRLPGRALLPVGAAACLLGILFLNSQHASARLFAPASPFAHAERLREALQDEPEAQRTPQSYERVLDAYRLVYHDDPAAPKAGASIDAVAGLLAEEGRLFRSEKLLHDAIGQYEFLRREYPRSAYRFSALMAEAEIYRMDLKDPDNARAKFQEFLLSYPRHPLATQARIEIGEMREEEVSEKRNRHRVVRKLDDEASFSESPGSHPVLRAPQRPQRPRISAEGARVEPRTVATLPIQPAAEPGRDPQSGPTPPESSLPPPALSSTDLAGTQPTRRKPFPRVTGIRYWSTAGYTRIAIDLNDRPSYQAARVPRPDRIYFDLLGTRLSPELAEKSVVVTDGGFLKRIRAAQYSNDVTRIVFDIGSATDYSAFFLPNPWRLIIDLHRRRGGVSSANEMADLSPESARESLRQSTQLPSPRNELESLSPSAPVTSRAGASSAPQAMRLEPDHSHRLRSTQPLIAEPQSPIDLPPMHEAEPATDGGRSLVRTLGLKIGRIVIDPGHGGHDSGTLGPGGIEEKDIVLDVALRLGKLLKRRLGADVIYTRDNDTFIPLETRTAIANKSRADLFISVHANSSSDPAARGVESYYLNFTTSPEDLEVAARENAVSDESIHELSSLVKKIALRDKIEESREFAIDVQNSLYGGLEEGNPGLKDRGVKKAPFVVLIGANMPSILAEISFLTNPEDAGELLQPAYRERIAESLYRGIAKYINGLSGIRLAQNGEHSGN